VSETTEATVTTTTDGPDEEDLAMASAFDATRGVAAPAPAHAAADAFVAAVDNDVGEVPDASAAAPAATTQATVEALPNDEFAALKTRVDKFGSVESGLASLAGTVGGIKRTLLQLQEIQKNSAPQSAAARGAVKLEAAIMAELAEDYPDIAEKLLPAFERAFAAAPAPAGASEDVIALRARLDVAEAKLEKKDLRELNKLHPNWETDLVAARDEHGEVLKNDKGQVVPGRAFVAWLATKPAEFRTVFYTGDDVEFVAEGLTDFKKFKETQGSPAATPAAAAAPAPAVAAPNPRAIKQARLAAAVVPTGSPAPAVIAKPEPSEEDDMEQAFRRARGK
jgi:hypothetical protein